MRRISAIVLLVGSFNTSAAASQEHSAQPREFIPPSAPSIAPRPMLARVHPRAYDGHVEIPQWARDEGHNGVVQVVTTVDRDGKPTSVKVLKSSNSEAIDTAALEEAMELPYDPAQTVSGEPISGTVTLRFQFAKYLSDRLFWYDFRSYTCANMLGEMHWYTAANPETVDFFGPKVIYTGLAIRQNRYARPRMTREERERSRREREPMWNGLVEACKASPKSSFTDVMEDRSAFLEIYG